MTAQEVQEEIRLKGSPEAAAAALRYFKIGPGQYGEGDIFLGLRAADLHALSKKYRALPLPEVELLLQSPIHEDRAAALLILTLAFAKAGETVKKQIYDLYRANLRHVNNWDLVDASADHIVGGYLADRSRAPLYKLARSKSLWERRVAMVATLELIRKGETGETLALAEVLLHDKEDLIHKAAGWMLREVGMRDLGALEGFLTRHCRDMPRTMLRYAIEKLPPEQRQGYLKGKPLK